MYQKVGLYLMRKIVFVSCVILGLAACSSQPEQIGGGVYDMKTVQEYNARVLVVILLHKLKRIK